MPVLSLTVAGLLSAVFAAGANILARVLVKNAKSQQMLSLNFVVMALTLALFSPLFYRFSLSWKTAGLVALVGLIDGAANYFYFKTLEKTEASIATPILSLAPGFAFVFGWLFLGDVVSLQTLILAIAIIMSIIIFSIDFKNFDRFRRSSLLPALSAALLFGISAIPSKELLSQLHAVNAPTLFMFRVSIIALLAWLLFDHVPLRKVSTHQYRLIFIRGLVVIAQWLLLYEALKQGSAGVAVTLANTTPVFVFIFGTLFLRERPTVKKIIAVGLIIGLSLLI